MKHPAVPETLTPENLAQWIKLNKVDVTTHVEEVALTEEEISDLAMDSSLASRAMDKLKGVKAYFDEVLKLGTPFDNENDQHLPVAITIPPTKGLKKLEANREYADKCIDRGFKEVETPLFLIPYPETSMMIMVDIEGYEWSGYSRKMTIDEINQHKPLLRKIANDFRDGLAESGMKVEGFDASTNTLNIRVGDKPKKIVKKSEEPFI